MNSGLRAVVALSVALAGSAAVSAGPLTPPAGAVAPTGKTLTQVEPRTPISAATTPGDATSQHVITQPGSYYLTGNVQGQAGKHGIFIAASGVTIDLNGFTMDGAVSGGGNSLSGIAVAASLRDVCVRNGTVKNWGAQGVALSATRCMVESVLAVGNGNGGITVGPESIVRDCIASENGMAGISGGGACSVSGCVARNNGLDGISLNWGVSVSRCVAEGNGDDGIEVSDRSSVVECTASLNDGNGVNLGLMSTAQNCTVASNGRYGIDGSGRTLILNNTVRSNALGGIYVVYEASIEGNLIVRHGDANQEVAGIVLTDDNSTVDGNTLIFNHTGIRTTPLATRNLIIRNRVRNLVRNFDVIADNRVGVLVNAPASGAVVGAAGGAGVGTTDPWANISY